MTEKEYLQKFVAFFLDATHRTISPQTAIDLFLEQRDKMTEKEFLERFINFVYYTENKSNWFLAIDNFLEAMHKEYHETTFVKKSGVIWQGVEIIWDDELAALEANRRPENE
jgi:hypothetical protein